jgi:hypothetical protein
MLVQQTPLLREGRPEEVAAAVSGKASVVNGIDVRVERADAHRNKRRA